METSVFLAKWLGIYCIIISLLMLGRKRSFLQGVYNLLDNPGNMLLTGALSLIIGIGIVLAEPHWSFDYKGLILIIGLISCAKGILRIGFPRVCLMITDKIISHPQWYFFMSLILLIVGIFFLVKGNESLQKTDSWMHFITPQSSS